MIDLTPSVIFATAQDAGNRSMRKGNRKAWNEADFNAACEESIRLHSSLGTRLPVRIVPSQSEPQ